MPGTVPAVQVEPGDILERAAHVAWRSVDGETLIVDPDSGRALCLNQTGGVLWEALDGKTPLLDLVERELVAGFEVETPQALHDARQVLEDLMGRGLVRRVRAG